MLAGAIFFAPLPVHQKSPLNGYRPDMEGTASTKPPTPGYKPTSQDENLRNLIQSVCRQFTKQNTLTISTNYKKGMRDAYRTGPNICLGLEYNFVLWENIYIQFDKKPIGSLSWIGAEEREVRVSWPQTSGGLEALRNIATGSHTPRPPRSRRGAPQGSTARG